MTRERGDRREIRPGVRRVVRLRPRDGDGLADQTEEEIALHLQLRTEELVGQGWSPDEARAEANRRFGSIYRARRRLMREARGRERRMRMMGWWEGMRLDGRLAVRRLTKRPGFAVIAILTLALGVGVNAALFSVVHDSLLHALPFPHPDRLVRVLERTGEGRGGNVSLPNFSDLRAANRTLASVASFEFAKARARFGDETELLSTILVEPDLFDVLGRAPMYGRVPGSGEDHAVVVSHRFWQSRLGGDPHAVGTTLHLEGDSYAVVGVMPPDFTFTSDQTDLWAVLTPEAYLLNRRVHVLGVVARVRSGVSDEEVRADLARVSANIQTDHPGEDPGHAFVARPLRDTITGYARTPLFMLAGAVFLVLLMACANLAGLQIARAVRREGEMEVRLALGAGRGALARQLLVENVILFALGAIVSIPVAKLGVRWLLAHAPGGLPRAAEIAVDGTTLTLTLAVAVGLGLLFGLAPALHAARTRLSGTLGTRSEAGGTRRAAHRTRSALLVGQLALTVALLSGAGLLLRSLWALENVEPGFEPRDLAVLHVALPNDYDGDVPAFFRRVPQVLDGLPGVEATTATSALPVSGGDGRGEVRVDGRPLDPENAPGATYRRVLPDYFGVMGIPLMDGRQFTDRDGEGDPVVVINATMARRLFPDGDAVGQRIKVGPAESEPWLTVVGVVGDVRNESLENVDDFATYEPHAQRPWTSMYVVMRTRGTPAAVIPGARRALLGFEPRLYLYESGTMESRMTASTASRRFDAFLMTTFALVALLLGAVGMYGLTSYSVAQRRREIGVRIALGATGREILTLIMGGTTRLLLVGLVLGLAGAAATMRLLRSLLYEVSPFDLPTLAGMLALLGGATLVAAWLPARRARVVSVISSLGAD
jgi:putative ABC transport system permease protein